jgi:hypothetical protein
MLISKKIISQSKRIHKLVRKVSKGQKWWPMPVNLALGRLQQEDHEFKVSPSHILCLKKKSLARFLDTR